MGSRTCEECGAPLSPVAAGSGSDGVYRDEWRCYWCNSSPGEFWCSACGTISKGEECPGCYWDRTAKGYVRVAHEEKHG